MAKGKMIYVPPSVMDEVRSIQKEDKEKQRADAFRKMVKYSKVGREAKRILRFRW